MESTGPEPMDQMSVKRERPKTKKIRVDFKNNLETMLLTKNSPILYLFNSTDVENSLCAPLNSVLPLIGYDESHPLRRLSRKQICDISNLSRIFNIVGVNDEPLKIVFDNRFRDNLEDKTVYVDNLPPSCSALQLKRRASVFGNVVHVHLPLISRLRRRCCPGAEVPLNSGFGFIQFASKVAVRRICKRYIANCHLNRTHHPKTHKKRKAQSTNTIGQIEPPILTPEKVVTRFQDSSFFIGQLAATSSGGLERRKRRTTVSISVDESETESDFPTTKTKISNDIDKATPVVEDKTQKKTRRKRKKIITTFSLTKFLSKIQVFSFSKYRALRQEYLDMKKENYMAFRKDLNERGVFHSIKNTENGDPQPASRRRKRRKTTDQQKKKTKSSQAHAMEIVTKLKDESFVYPKQEQNDPNDSNGYPIV
ncbi:RRM domain-containing protein [Aphelenchoides besseyi]|nr:RRM domain-containing protein [Aphelenchoides besseyi]KAI6219663.1 RRM domain-containing protein [Aphelenchoides besseyi]